MVSLFESNRLLSLPFLCCKLLSSYEEGRYGDAELLSSDKGGRYGDADKVPLSCLTLLLTFTLARVSLSGSTHIRIGRGNKQCALPWAVLTEFSTVGAVVVLCTHVRCTKRGSLSDDKYCELIINY